MSVCNTNRRLASGVIRRVLHHITRGTTRAQIRPSNHSMWHAAGATSMQRPAQYTRSSLMDSRTVVIPNRYLSSSAALSAAQEIDSFETILSESNKSRCQSKLLSVEPVRKFTQLAKSAIVEKAAVLVLLCSVDGKPSVLFTERSNQLYAHRGEISFAGGKADATDTNLSHTALREADEEIGLCSEKVDVWGEMLPVPGKRFSIAVTPILACYTEELDLASLKLNRHEVESVFAPSIEALCHPESNHYTCFRASEMMTRGTLEKYHKIISETDMFVMPVYVVEGRRIWGLSAIILNQVLRLVAGGLYVSPVRPFSWPMGQAS